MPKSTSRIDLSDPKEVDLFFLGISSAAGIAVICHKINQYLGVKLSYFDDAIISITQSSILDNIPVFTSFEPKANEPENSSLDLDDFSLDLNPCGKVAVCKYLLIKCKGNSHQLFPKIQQLDFLLVSNYELKTAETVINQIPEVTITFSLFETHIGKRRLYFRKLFYTI